MATKKKAPVNPAIDEIIRKIVKSKEDYKLDKKETDPSSGLYGIEIAGEDITFFVYLDVYESAGMVTFTTVVDDLSERADRIGCDPGELYLRASEAVTGYSFRLTIDDDGKYLVDFRYTALNCSTEEDIVLGIETCIDAAWDYIVGLEEKLGVIY